MLQNSDRVLIYDTTLRDGTQAEKISFSKSDKLRIVQMLDDFGVAYIEGGLPGSNPRDAEFFESAKSLCLKHAKLSAFGSTCRAGLSPENDESIGALLRAETPVVTIFGKAWMLHVKDVLRVSCDENLRMIYDSCRYLRQKSREVVFDAEHFFDGYAENPEYSMQVIKTVIDAGVSVITLCDTNGGMLPAEISDICQKVRQIVPENIMLGIHCHNDSDMAVAGSIVAVQAGVQVVQGTINGIGERQGNANLCSVIANLELKLNRRCIPKNHLQRLREISFFVDDMANIRHNNREPFVGDSAFAHKGGMHVDAVKKNPRTFEHIVPSRVGNRRRILLSDLSGKDNLIFKASELGLTITKKSDIVNFLSVIKEREQNGYEYESADASFAVLLYKMCNSWNHYFKLEGFRVIVEKRFQEDKTISEATVKLSVNGKSVLTAAEGDGPVNALDLALRKSLERFYPEIKDFFLSDFKVRILDTCDGTASKTRVLIESSDGINFWKTVGVSENIIQASWEALVDSVEYSLFRRKVKSVLIEELNTSSL